MYSCADQPGYDGRTDFLKLPSGRTVEVIQASIKRGEQILEEADIRVAHNGQDFDERIGRKLNRAWSPKPGSTVMDTLLLSRLLFPEIRRLGPNTQLLPPKLKDKHSLEAWGWRLGERKDSEFDPGDWQTWTPGMQAYMMQDVFTLVRLFKYLMSQKPSAESVNTEHGFAAIIRRQESWGFTFDHTKALTLATELQRTEANLEQALIDKYGEWWEPGNLVTIKGTRAVKMPEHPNVIRPRLGKNGRELAPYVGPPLCTYDEGAQFTPIKRVTFNPSSRDHVRLKLGQMHGWKPTKRTKPTKAYPKGQIQVDDDVLRSLPWPEAHQLADYYVVMKVRGYLSTGKKAWLKLSNLEPDGCYRMHGQVNTNRAISGRCGHMNPNLGQVPAIVSKGDSHALLLEGHYGYECRDLFMPRPGYALVGHDGSGLEYGMLGHYTAKWDGGAFSQIVTSAKPHKWFQEEVVGTNVVGSGKEGYDKMKTVGYAFIYGAGDLKIGTIIAPTESERERRKLGAEVKRRMVTKFEALGQLIEALNAMMDAKGCIIGLDGRRLYPRSKHARLNILLQAAGAVVMKRSLIILDNELQAAGWVPGVLPTGETIAAPDYEFCANVHDEAQADVKPERVAEYIPYAVRSVPAAGEYYKLRCPLKAEAKTGASWAQTH